MSTDDGGRPRIGIVGARGHVGAELLRLLADHPRFSVVAVASRALRGRPVKESIPSVGGDLLYEELAPKDIVGRRLDACVLALPNGEAAPYVEAIDREQRSIVVVDLSADYRFDKGWVYGLPEHTRTTVTRARRIANPGCYATGIQLGLMPLRNELEGSPHVFGVSGYSGAGTTPSLRNDPDRLTDNLIPYGLVDHLHEREASHHLGYLVRFMPHVAQFFRGISLTLSCELKRAHSLDSIVSLYEARYRDEALVRISRETPEIRSVANHHHAELGGFILDSTGRRLVLVSVLDNLLKGAATQALQNLNLAFGFAETMGLMQ